MYNAVSFTLLGGGICCIPLKNVVLCSRMYLFRQSSILLSLLSNFIRPGPEQSLAQSSFTLTVRRPLLRTVWPPAYCEVFPLMGAFCELRITAGCSVEALPQPQVASDTTHRLKSPSVSGASSVQPLFPGSLPRKTRHLGLQTPSPSPPLRETAGLSLDSPSLSCSLDTPLGSNWEQLWALLRLFH